MNLHTFTNADDGMTALVNKIDRGYSVVLRDDDSGEYVTSIKIFPTLDGAIANAKELAA